MAWRDRRPLCALGVGVLSVPLRAAGKVSIRMEGKDTEHTCPVGPPLRAFERPEKGPCAQPAEPPGALGVGQRMPLPACPSGRNKGAARLCVGAEGRGSGAPVWGGLWQKPPVFYYCCFQRALGNRSLPMCFVTLRRRGRHLPGIPGSGSSGLAGHSSPRRWVSAGFSAAGGWGRGAEHGCRRVGSAPAPRGDPPPRPPTSGERPPRSRCGRRGAVLPLTARSRRRDTAPRPRVHGCVSALQPRARGPGPGGVSVAAPCAAGARLCL